MPILESSAAGSTRPPPSATLEKNVPALISASLTRGLRPLRSQDYEQNPQSSRDDMMCHCFYYLQGLNGEVGDLAILPGSHKIVMERGAM